MNVQERVVSFWAGTARSDEDLEDYLTFVFDEDGNAIPCAFGRDFHIDWFDEDFREAEVESSASRSLRELLAGYSDAGQIIPAFTALVGELLPFEANAVVLLYDFKYDGAVKSVESGPVQLRFVGAANYQ